MLLKENPCVMFKYKRLIEKVKVTALSGKYHAQPKILSLKNEACTSLECCYHSARLLCLPDIGLDFWLTVQHTSLATRACTQCSRWTGTFWGWCRAVELEVDRMLQGALKKNTCPQPSFLNRLLFLSHHSHWTQQCPQYRNCSRVYRCVLLMGHAPK